MKFQVCKVITIFVDFILRIFTVQIAFLGSS